MAKSVATRRGIPSGVLATAASMDGYCSSGAALIRGGVKVTDTVNAPSDVLIDTGIVCHAPKNLTAAGFGDILGKNTCLADWRLANLLKDEAVHEEAYAMMEAARSKEDAFISYGNCECDGRSNSCCRENCVRR